MSMPLHSLNPPTGGGSTVESEIVAVALPSEDDATRSVIWKLYPRTGSSRLPVLMTSLASPRFQKNCPGDRRARRHTQRVATARAQHLPPIDRWRAHRVDCYLHHNVLQTQRRGKDRPGHHVPTRLSRTPRATARPCCAS